MDFKNKIVLIIGANKGIGKIIAKEFISRGAFIIGTSTNKSGIINISNYTNNYGLGIKLDITSNKSVNLFLKKIQKRFKKIDILINNAGIKCDSLLINMKEDDWKSVINVNLIFMFRILKTITLSMMRHKYGRIIMIGSVIGSLGNIGQTNYSASKSGLIGFNKSLALEVASKGITVNIISPGFISTSMTKSLKDKYRKKILSKIPIKRFGNPEEIAKVVAFIASKDASYITGENIHVNGGMYMP